MLELCAVDDLENPGSKGFETEKGSIFVVRRNEEVFVYENSCPHFGINLEWQKDRFLDSEKRLIQCATHRALFLMESGECVAGPCPGDRLTAVPSKVEQGIVYLL
ncbi:Rieske (2Fe-2S) protein [Endozoicomonas numazuensis]|uniref:(2Fe-2S)-binding protein n=1 Tax=Endozoicomonas numazuensis TaxID=1137799 RepID=A0A081NEF3_9GAMM|nr:Rieske (2Fe-2S) protein [Endozoicomonas numazuensis]KEQ16826.1 (2Fe-2S)-binding protein [Endozoicomonas numazuensis]